MMLKSILNNEYLVNEDYNATDDSYDLRVLIDLTNNKHSHRFQEVLDSIKYKYLYRSKKGNLIHGQNHIERVVFYANILAILNDINGDDYKLLMDAAIYHDSGRIGDFDDNLHGFLSAKLVDKIFKDDEFYKTEDNLNMLKAMIDFHALDDTELDRILEFYDVKDKVRCKKLAYLLKDADALDRVRFIESDAAYLNENYLRNSQSVRLIQAAKELVNIYINPVINKVKKVMHVVENTNKVNIDLHVNDNVNTNGCFHGINFDFFKLDSILVRGILSPVECKKANIITSKNYNTSISNYVYVLPEKAFEGDFTSYETINKFITNGISFYALVPNLVSGLDNRDEAIEKGLPYTIGEHRNEMFVKKEIPVDSIEYVILNSDIYDKKLDEIDYFECNITPNIIKEKIFYYMKNLKEKLGYEVGTEEINIELQLYECIFLANKVKDNKEDIYKVSSHQRGRINNIIGGYMQEAYTNILGSEATVGKVVEHIISNRRENYNITNTGDEVMIKVK